MLRPLGLVMITAALSVASCSPPAPTTEAPAAEPAAQTVKVEVATPVSGARVTSPFRVEGTAPGDWFFEAQFPTQLVGADGQMFAEAPAQPQSETMTEAPVPFVAELRFTVTQETPATLVLQEDMPGDGEHPREVRIPVVLAPG